DVTGDVDLGDIVLQDGFVVSGTVRDPGGAPVAGADLDAFLPGECRRFPLADGVADANGQFSFRVEPGTWDFVANPPPGVTLPTTRFGSVDVSGDLARDFQLQTDPAPFEVSSVVEDPDGLPVAGAIVRGVPASGAASWEATTDAAGEFVALAPPGRHRLEITPPSGSGLGVRILEGVDLPCALGPALSLLPFVDPNPPAAPAPLRAAPNPWRETTTLQLDIPAAVASARVTVYDVSGRRVREVYRGALEAGEGREILWDGRDDAGRPTATGVYFVRAELGRTTTTAKTVRLRP
ncbi:MAG: T9SS type A sorting domain-containing protein, partial [Gemmatimonadetes bacterium]|nr:T9SS type A sorting domain-containing protein [Gemmatimonadota bacterium]